MMQKFRRLFNSELLLGYAVVGGLVYTNLGELKLMWKYYRNQFHLKDEIKMSYKRTMQDAEEHAIKEADATSRMLNCSTVNEVLDSLRTGDMIFMRYNESKLSWPNRCRLSLARWLSKSIYYDDVGIAYKYNGKTYVIVIPPMKLYPMDNATMPPVATHKADDAMVFVNSDVLLSTLSLDVMSVKRLICDPSRREVLQNVMKQAFDNSKEFQRSALVHYLINFWSGEKSNEANLFNYIQCQQLLRDNKLMELGNTQDVRHPNNGIAYNPSLVSRNRGDTVEGNASENQGTRHSPIEHSKEAPSDVNRMCKQLVEAFKKYGTSSVQQKKRTGGTLSFTTHVYIKAGIIPEFCRLDTMKLEELFNVDCLPDESRQDNVQPRLSQHLNVFNEYLCRARFNNLKELSDIDMLWNKH